MENSVPSTSAKSQVSFHAQLIQFPSQFFGLYAATLYVSQLSHFPKTPLSLICFIHLYTAWKRSETFAITDQVSETLEKTGKEKTTNFERHLKRISFSTIDESVTVSHCTFHPKGCAYSE